MGLLDDAIREHLDLKRRRGADPGEVERLEREALGPVRRPAQEPRDFGLEESAVSAAVSSSDEAVLYSEEVDEEWVEDAPVREPAASTHDEAVFDNEFDSRAGIALEPEAVEQEPPPQREAPLHHEIAEEWDAHEPLDLQEPDDDPFGREPDETEPQTAEHSAAEAAPSPDGAPPPAPAPAEGNHLGEETVEYDVEAEELAASDDDVLEETPEFLQDTPDHDRLWFEQKPPRDFDFDG
jgi:hypothetical protein